MSFFFCLVRAALLQLPTSSTSSTVVTCCVHYPVGWLPGMDVARGVLAAPRGCCSCLAAVSTNDCKTDWASFSSRASSLYTRSLSFGCCGIIIVFFWR